MGATAAEKLGYLGCGGYPTPVLFLRRPFPASRYCSRCVTRQWPDKKLVKIERLSSLPPAKSGRACHDNPTGRGYFYQMPNMYTCIAYLIEIRKFCAWFIKVLILKPKML